MSYGAWEWKGPQRSHPDSSLTSKRQEVIDLHQNDRKMAMQTQVSVLSGQSFPHDTHTATVLHLSTTMSRGRGQCGCPLYHRMFSSIPGPYPAPRIMTTKDVSGHCQTFPGRQNHPWLRTSTLED